MTTELLFKNHKIPVSFISSDQKAIPQLLTVLERETTRLPDMGSDWSHIERIEIIGNNAVLHTKETSESLNLPLY